MKIALLQDEIFLPSYAGGIKANRCLLEALAEAGHETLALTRALTRSPDGPNDLQQLRAEMDARQLALDEPAPRVLSYQSRGVTVEAMDLPDSSTRRAYIESRIGQFQPDYALVADDKRRFMLAAATAAVPGRAIPLLQTTMHLPFGPLSVDNSESQTDLMRRSPLIIVISRFMQGYIREHSGLDSCVVHLPVYGSGPFPDLARHDRGRVTMINPCPYKGDSIFRALASEHPTIPFAAVPTWGADDRTRGQLQQLPNVRLLEPSDDIDEILAQTRILLVPSLWPESFGYVVPEAMLRGIPVLASNLGGLPEAKLGVEYLLPVEPATRCGTTYECPPQDIRPWSEALTQLLNDATSYESCSRRSRQAALDFVSNISIGPFERLLSALALP